MPSKGASILLPLIIFRIMKMRFFMPEKLKTILSIGGSDPTGGAGIQTDIRCGISLGLHVATAITAVTVQNSHDIMAVNPVDSNILKKQTEAILEDVMPDAVKIGMIGSVENVKVISDFIKYLPDEIPLVVDPVISASVGSPLSVSPQGDMISKYITEILPFATVATPNLSEAEEFLNSIGIKPAKDNLALSSQFLIHLGLNAIILKGGHQKKEVITDYLADNIGGAVVISESSHKRVECGNLHGTGCDYSAFLASYLALGFPLQDAFLKTSSKMWEIISHSCDYMLGKSEYGPLNINGYRI